MENLGSLIHDRKILKSTSKEVCVEESKQWAEKIKSILMNKYSKVACGLAGVQVGLLVRVFATYYLGQFKAYSNPQLLEKEDEYEVVEGCLSVSGYYKVRRFGRIKVFDDINGEKLLEGPEAQIWLHEFNHLNGVLISDGGKKVWRDE